MESRELNRYNSWNCPAFMVCNDTDKRSRGLDASASTCFSGMEAKADTSSVDAPADFASPIASIKRG